MREEWNSLWVCKRCLEKQHPQDFVEATEDDQTVPIALLDDRFLWGRTTLRFKALGNSSFIQLLDSTGIKANDPIGITLDNGVVHWSFITADPISNDVRIVDYISWQASEGNIVYGPFIGSGSTVVFEEEELVILPIYTEMIGPLMTEDAEYIFTETKLRSSDYAS